jgi:hypothetical protein
MSDRLADSDDYRRVVRADRIHDGRIFDIVGDTVELSPGTEPVRREYMVHPGAVAIVALRGEAGAEQVLLVRQYRHASRAQMYEIPAGSTSRARTPSRPGGASCSRRPTWWRTRGTSSPTPCSRRAPRTSACGYCWPAT